MLIGLAIGVNQNPAPTLQQLAEAAPVAARSLADKELSAGYQIPDIDVSGDFSGDGLSYALAPGSTALPEGLSLDAASGRITGTPTQETAPQLVRVHATNSGGFDESAFSLSVLTPVVLRNPDNTLSVIAGADGGPVEITVTSDAHSGTYSIDPTTTPMALEQAGILNTKPPYAGNAGEVGDIFEARQPLTIYNDTGAPPTYSGQWYLDGQAIPQATDLSVPVSSQGVLDYRAQLGALTVTSNTALISLAPPVATLEGLVAGPTPNISPVTTLTTHATLALGTPTADRVIYAVALMRKVNILGVELQVSEGATYAMTPVENALADNGVDRIAIYKAQVPNGSVADITLIGDAANPTGRSSVAVYAATNVSAEGDVATLEAPQARGAFVDALTLDASGPGFVLAAGFGINLVDHANWTGVVEDGVQAIQSISPFTVASGPVSSGTHMLGYDPTNDLSRVAIAIAVS